MIFLATTDPYLSLRNRGVNRSSSTCDVREAALTFATGIDLVLSTRIIFDLS